MRKPASKHEYWMEKTIALARNAELEGDRPFGCLIVHEEKQVWVSMAYGTGIDSNPLRHSECRAIEKACEYYGHLLEGHALYSTHEPCHMCAGAILHSHVSEVVWGSYRDDLPDLFRSYDIDTVTILMDCGHRPKITPGVLRDECIHLFDAERSELANARAGF